MRLAACLIASLVSLSWAIDAGFGEALANSAPFISASSPIPRNVHFIFGLVLGDNAFEFHHYLAVKSAYDSIKPDNIFLWMHYDMHGPWWEKARELVTVKYIDLIDTVYGNPIAHFAHRADVLRLKVLHEFGGIYLDMDVISLKSFDDLLNHDFVLGQEGESGDIGLCNGVILSQPRAPFLRRWMESYRNFDGVVWAWHSVSIPSYLSKVHPLEIHVLNHTAFFAPLWNEPGLQKLYMEKTYDFSNNYAVHLWESNAKHWFLSQLTPELVTTIDQPFMCELRRFVDLEPSLTSNCELAKDNLYIDGIVSHYNFDNDEPASARIEDSLANGLHGWALNGTVLELDTRGGQSRRFRGRGDFAILPALASQVLSDFTIQFRIRFDGINQPAASILALQSDEHTILIEGTMAEAKHKIWLKVYRSLQDENQLVYFDVVRDHRYSAQQWVTVTLRANSSAGSMELFGDEHLVAKARWPIPFSWGPPIIKNIWLGARPASPFPDPHRKDAVNDFKGVMDDLTIWDRAMPSTALAKTAAEPARAFRRHIELITKKQDHIAISLRADVEKPDQITWYEDKSQMSTTSRLPLVFDAIWPVKQSQWSLSWIMSLTSDFDAAGIPAPGTVWSSDVDILGLSFENGRYLGVTYDTTSGQLLLKQFGFGWPTILRTDAEKACSLAAGRGAQLHLALTVNKPENAVYLHCGTLQILYRPLAGLNETNSLTLKNLDQSRASITTLELRLGESSHAERVASADVMMTNKPTFTAEVDGRSISVGPDVQRTDDIWLPSDALQSGSMFLYIDAPAAFRRLSPRLRQLEGGNDAYLVGVPVVRAVAVNASVFEIQASDFDCGGATYADISLVIPELFARFAWQMSCGSSETADSVIDTLAIFSTAQGPTNSSLLFYGALLLPICAIGLLWLLSSSLQVSFVDFSPAIQLPISPVVKEKLSEGKRPSANFESTEPASRKRRYLVRSLVCYYICFFLLSSRPSASSESASQPTRLLQGLRHANRWTRRTSHGGHLAVPPIAKSRPTRQSNYLARPTFSVITPCYNQGQWLPEAYRFLLQQTYPWIEWIIVNDGSPDNCLAVARELQAQHRVTSVQVIDKPQGGLADARNVGIQAASSDWICLLDADDGLESIYFQLAADAILRDPTITAITANQRFFGESDWLWDLSNHRKQDMLYNGQFPIQTIFRRQDWMRVNGFEATLPWGNEDWSFWISLSFLPGFKVKKLDGELIFYRYKAISMQREKEGHKEVVPMMMTLHPDKYTREELLLAHEQVGRFTESSTIRLVDELSLRFPERRAPLLWKGIIAEQQGRFNDAVRLYQASIASDVGGKDWQASYRLDVVYNRIKSSEQYYGM